MTNPKPSGLMSQLGSRLLGRHVVRCAERHARFGHPSVRCRAQRQRDPEVGHHLTAIVEQDVLGFDVAVDDVMAMGVVECVGDGGGDAHRFLDAELRFAVEPVPQRLAVDERHDIIKERVGFARIEQRQDVGVLKIGRGRDLLQEAVSPEHRREFGSQYLDRHFALVLQVFGK